MGKVHVIIRVVLATLLICLAYKANGTSPGDCAGSAELGDCGTPADCNQRCQSAYPGNSKGRCLYTIYRAVCTCDYNCAPPQGPQCTTYNGFCGVGSCIGDCCTEQCQAKYPSPGTSGMCNQMVYGYRVCFCTHNC